MKRIDYLDIAKGLGIILVVIGHLDSTCVHTIIYYFHMPLFFFISGIFYDPSHDFLLKKIKQAFIPIFVFSAISFPIKFIERSFLQEHVYFNLSYLTFQFYNIPLWFLISLFTIAILFYLVDITCSKRIKNLCILLHLHHWPIHSGTKKILSFLYITITNVICIFYVRFLLT